MMDWNGDGRINSMDTYDMMHDTSGGVTHRKGSGMPLVGATILKFLFIPAIALFISLFNEGLAIIIVVIWGISKICFLS